MSARFVPSTAPVMGVDALWIGIRGMDVLVLDHGDHDELPVAAEPAALGIAPVRSLYLGELDGVPCRSAELPDDHEAPEGMAFRSLRELYGRIDEELWTLAGRAAQLVEWDRTHIHCGRCGTPTEHAPGERARRCPVCGLSAFPRLSPAVIMRVTRGDEILLARALRFPGCDVQRARGLRRAGRVARGVRRARARGGGRHRGRRHHLLRQPALAVPPLADDRLHGALGQRRSPPSRRPRWPTRSGSRATTCPSCPGRLSIARKLIDDWL